MGLSSEMVAELAWLQKLGDAASPIKSPVKSTLDNAQYEPSFDLAEVLEQGLGPGPTSTYVEPPAEGMEERMVVQRGPNHQGFLLTTQGGEPLLLARSNKNGTEYQIYPGHKWDADDDLKPMFSLQSNKEKNRWTLHSIKCERCQSRNRADCGQRLLARFTHYTEKSGPDCTSLLMDVQVPEVRQDGTLDVLCTACGDPMQKWSTRPLSTRRPKWNAKVKCMVLDFNKRCTVPSAKNFQLETVDEDPSKMKLLFGKVGDQRFNIDYRRPLGTIQAFAAALTASHWT